MTSTAVEVETLFKRISDNRAKYAREKTVFGPNTSQEVKDLILNYENDINTYITLALKLSGDDLEKYAKLDVPVVTPSDIKERVSHFQTEAANKLSAEKVKPLKEKNVNDGTDSHDTEHHDVGGGSGSGRGNTRKSRFDPSSLSFAESTEINVQAANELTPNQIEKFQDILYDYFKFGVFKLKESEEISKSNWGAALASYYASLYEQSTSRENANNSNLINTFRIDGAEYHWDRAAVVRAVQSHFSGEGVQNAERRYARAKFNEIQQVISNSGHKPSQRLAAQWGVAGSYRTEIGDFIPMHKSNGSVNNQTAQMAATEYATDKGGESTSIVHTSQILGKRRRG
ncbi:coat protein [Pyrus virus A]|uniref:Coat protein n=5 Tax=Pyrus virus A TaxID=3139198 RepID=A0AAU6RW07_9CLOS